MEFYFYIIFVTFIFGSIIGSFSNCLIYRLPLNISLITKSSFCPSCKKKIPIRFNIPIIAWILLKGKCYYCNESISKKYPIIEFFSAVLAVTMLWVTEVINVFDYQINITKLPYLLFSLFLIPIFFIDLKHKLIHDKITIPLIISGFAFSFLIDNHTPIDSLIGLLVGGGLPLLIYYIGLLLFKKEGLGGGDIKLLAAFGAWFGPLMPIFAIFISSVLALLFILMLKIKTKEKLQGKEIAFGPFLAIAMILTQVLFFRTEILSLLFIYGY